MPVFFDETGIVAISKDQEATYGAGGITPDRVIFVDKGSAGYSFSPNIFDRGNLATGYEESTGALIEKFATRLSFQGPISDNSMGILLTAALGNDANGTVDTGFAELHSISPFSQIFQLESRTIQVNHRSINSVGDSTAKIFYGAVVDNLTISMADGSPWRFNVDFAVSGQTLDGSSLASTSTGSLPMFNSGRSYFKINPTPATSAGSIGTSTDAPTSSYNPTGVSSHWTSGQIDLSTALRGVTYSVQNGLQAQYTGNVDGYISRLYRSPRNQTITVDLNFDDIDGTDITYLPKFPNFLGATAGSDAPDFSIVIGNRQPVKINPSGTYYHAFTGFFPKVSLVGVSSPTGSPRRQTVTFAVREPLNSLSTCYWLFYNGDIGVEYSQPA